MADIQLEFNINNISAEDMKLSLLQKQIDDLHESMGKVRRKIFSEIGEIKKLYNELQNENENLKNTLRELKNEKMEWTYGKNDCLFELQEYK